MMKTQIRLMSAAGLLSLLCALGATAGFAAQNSESRHAPRVKIPQANTLAIRKDPFVSPIDDEAQEAPARIEPTPQIAAVNSMVDAGPAAAAAAPAIRLQGVMVGDRSYAVIEDGNTQRIVTVGDVIGNAKITRITLNGVDLQNGVHIMPSKGTP